MAESLRTNDECYLPDTTTCLEQLLKLFEDKASEDQLDRQLILLNTFLSSSGGKVKIVDLELLCGIMWFLKRRARFDSRYTKPFQSVLDFLKQPPNRKKSSDELNYKPFLVQLYSTLGCFLLKTIPKDIQSQILDIIEKMMVTKRSPDNDMMPVKSCIHALDVSLFMDCLSDFLVVVDEDLYGRTVYTALQICLLSEFSCWTLLINNAIEILLVRLAKAKDEERSEVVDITHQLLWKLFNCSNHSVDWMHVPIPSRVALRSLRCVLRKETVNHNFPRDSSGLRNVSALLLKMMHLFPKADYVLSGLIEDITFLATLSEVVIPIDILPNFKSERDHLEFKKLMLACLSLSPICQSSLEIFEPYKVAECLVFMLGGDPCCGRKVVWSPDHALELFQAALPVVNALFNCLQKAFIDAGLMKELVMFLKVNYLDGKNPLDDLVPKVLKTVLLVCYNKEYKEATLSAFRDAGIINVLMELCKIILKSDSSLTLFLQSILTQSLSILTKIMKNKTLLQNSHGETSFLIVTNLYRRILKPLPEDSLIDNRLYVEASDFAWEILVWNKDNVLRFISSGSIFTHIDIMEKSPYSVQLVYLSMLVDICEYHQSVPYLVTWRGQGGVKLLSLLCKIWRSEEERINVPRSEQGCITDIESPLMGKTQNLLGKEKENKDPISICDIFVSARPKIYALVQLLERHKDVTDLCEDHYKLGHDKLPCQDLVTLQVIKAYFPLKLGEIWWAIRSKQDKVLPLDKYLAETLTERYLNWALRVQQAQISILAEENLTMEQEEQKTYDLLRSDQLTSALAALREVKVVARTTDRQILQSSNRRLRDGIHNSRANVDAELQVTYPIDLLVVNSKSDVVLNLGTYNKSFTLSRQGICSTSSLSHLPENHENY